MLRSLFLIMCLFIVSTFAETQEKPKAYKFFEYGKISDKLLKEKIVKTLTNVAIKNNGHIFIVNYGKMPEINSALKQQDKIIRHQLDFDYSLITLVKGRIKTKKRSEVWIVPKGADLPIN